jgi:hypothetical protein
MRYAKLSAFLAITCLIPTFHAHSQVVAARTMPAAIGLFGEISTERPGPIADTTLNNSFLTGGTLGGYIQARPWLGLEARAVALRELSDEHQYFAFMGPRFASFHKRFQLDGVLLVGMSRSSGIPMLALDVKSGVDVFAPSTNPAMQASIGTEFRLARKLFWRVGEVGYSRTFVHGGLGGPIVSSGLALRLR